MTLRRAVCPRLSLPGLVIRITVLLPPCTSRPVDTAVGVGGTTAASAGRYRGGVEDSLPVSLPYFQDPLHRTWYTPMCRQPHFTAMGAHFTAEDAAT